MVWGRERGWEASGGWQTGATTAPCGLGTRAGPYRCGHCVEKVRDNHFGGSNGGYAKTGGHDVLERTAGLAGASDARGRRFVRLEGLVRDIDVLFPPLICARAKG